MPFRSRIDHPARMLLLLVLLPALCLRAADPAELPLPASAVRVTGGFVGERMQANKTGALGGFDIDRHVALFENHATTGWFWIGEQAGKWLESAVLSTKAQPDPRLEARAQAVLARILRSQQSDGYIGITADHMRSSARPLRGMDPYEHYFTLHALLTAYEVWGERQALSAATRLGDYYLAHVGPDKAQFWPSPLRPPENAGVIISPQIGWAPPGTPSAPELHTRSEIAGHSAHYGLEGTLLVDPILRLHQLTGETRFLDWARWVVSMVDTWGGWNTFSRLDRVAAGEIGVHELQPYVHAHTLHMNFLGWLRLYRITGDASLLRKMEGAWEDIAGRQTYLTGGVGVSEHYKPGYERPPEGDVVETCANMSWLEFNQALLELTGKTRYADMVERLLLNHVFAAQAIDGDGNRFHTPPNGIKPDGYFRDPDCCGSSGPRQIAMIARWIYARDPSALIVNQYVPSTAEFSIGDSRVTLVQETDYPESETITLTVRTPRPTAFALKLRLPAWCHSPELRLNADPVATRTAPGTYQVVDRVWRDGDRVELTLPMHPQIVEHDHYPAAEAPVALTRGPLVFALDTVWWDALSAGGAPPRDVGREVALSLDATPRPEPVDPRSLGPFYSLPVKLAGLPDDAPQIRATFIPFANVGRWYPPDRDKPSRHARAYSYAVWLPSPRSKMFTEQAAELVKLRDFGRHAVDYVLPGLASEAAHGLQADGSEVGAFNGRNYRDGESFGYVMSVSTENPSRLLVTYWGGESSERRFSIFVNGVKIASPRLLRNRPGTFFEEAYDIPFELIEGQTDSRGQKINKVTIRFVAAPGSTAGGVFGLRVIENPL